MDYDINYDVDMKKNLKELRLFLSIAPDKSQIKAETLQILNNSKKFEIPTLHNPSFSYFCTDKSKFVVENKENLLNFYKQEKEIFNEIVSNTYVVIATDENLTTYNRGIANYVQISYGNNLEFTDSPTEESSDTQYDENGRRIFITNFSLIKKLYEEDLKNLRVYLLHQDINDKIDRLFKKLDYAFRFIDDINLRREYFANILMKYKLKRLEINEKFLKIRNDFLGTLNKKNQGEMFKDPINKESVFPVLNIMVLNYLKDDGCEKNYLDEYHVNRIDFQYFDNGFHQNFQKYLVNSDITFVAYLDCDEMFSNSNEFSQDFPINPNELFVDKNISINFGKIEKIEELGCGHYNFMKTCSGSLIYGTKFMPLGITTIKHNNISFINKVSNKQMETKRASNIFLPFSNKGVISIFKKFLNVHSEFPNFSKDRLFAIEKPLSNQENHKFLNKYLWKSEINDQLSLNIKSCITPMYFSQSIFFENSERDLNLKNKKNFCILKSPQRFYKHDKPLITNMNKVVIDRLKNKSFNYSPFNKILEDKTNENKCLANFIDEKISNIFK